MKETNFIRQNIKKWNTYEQELLKQKKNPETVSKLFVQITDDLAFAQTFYKNRSVKVYLNGIAQLLFNDINKRNRIGIGVIKNFWTKDLPVVLFKTRFELLFSFVVFSLMVAIGVLTSVYEPEFASTILGENYVSMTITNIENDDPMAVYKVQNGLDMFLGITLNNIRVAFVTFLLGIFFGFGTFLSLLRNGIMLGSFQYFFIERDLFKESFLTIWQHGTLEISAIVIAGAAGFTIGRGLIAPGSYTRFQSLRLNARRGLKIMIGLVPVFILAGFIEGFFTRHTEVPDSIRLLSILLSLSFILFYFVFYPAKIARKYPEKIELADQINEVNTQMPDLNAVLSGEMLFGGTLKLLKEHFRDILKITLLMASLGAVFFIVGLNYFLPELTDKSFYLTDLINPLTKLSSKPLIVVLNSFIFGIPLLHSAYLIGQKQVSETSFKNYLKNSPSNLLNAAIICVIVQTSFFLPTVFATLLSIFIMPICLFVFYHACVKKTSVFKAVSSTFKMLSGSLGKFLLLNIKFTLICILALILFNPTFYTQFLSFIHWNLWIEDQYIAQIFNVLIGFIFYVCLILSLYTLCFTNNLLYYSLHEINTSENLLKQIGSMGTKNKLKGYEFE